MAYMKIGFVGLGKMGAPMVANLREHNHEVVAFDVNNDALESAQKEGAEVAASLREVVQQLPEQKVIWLMVPPSKVDNVIHELEPLLSPGDVVIDGGNCHYRESVRRAQRLRENDVTLLDVGTSGGMEGARHGLCLMVGGNKEMYKQLEPLFSDMATTGGYCYCGESGAGHFVKMVHNGIEYALMEAYAEGFELLKQNDAYPALDLQAIASTWNHGSIVRSFLLEKINKALEKDPSLGSIRSDVEDGGQGRWTVETAIHNAVPLPVIASALFNRFQSRDEEKFSSKLLNAMREEFGGHKVK